MSRTELKKALAGMSREQLQEMILDIYSARKDAKEYFEFYLNPDVNALLAKYRTAIYKEFERTRRGRSTARISRIKKAIRQFDSFSAGASYTITLILDSIRAADDACFRCYLTDTQLRSFSSLLQLAIDYANKNASFLFLIENLSALLKKENFTRRFYNSLCEILENNDMAPENNK